MAQHSTPRIVAFTLCYKEHVMLPLWINHYSKLVGRENLLILDHSNDPPVTIDGIKTEVIPRPNYDEVTRLNAIKTWQKKLLESYDWVIFSDTDEFIIFSPSSVQTTLQDYLERQKSQIIRCVGVDVIDPGNVPSIDWTQPILQQRPKGVISNWSCKALISSVANDWNPGFHTTNSPSTLDTHFWLFHLKYADETHLMKRLSMTRQFEWSIESTKAGYGGSHRVSDLVMKKHLNNLRNNKGNGNLDDFLQNLSNVNIDKIHSPLMDIPQDFIPRL